MLLVLLTTTYFNPLPPHGGRRAFFGDEILFTIDFNPLPPHGGRRGEMMVMSSQIHFNPLPPHGGRLVGRTDTKVTGIISIHSLRMEGDIQLLCNVYCFNIFQSTPSAWRETMDIIQYRNLLKYFNPLPPHGGRLCNSLQNIRRILFQSTPSAWRETIFSTYPYWIIVEFQSTPSAWRETAVNFVEQSLGSFQSTPSAWRET